MIDLTNNEEKQKIEEDAKKYAEENKMDLFAATWASPAQSSMGPSDLAAAAHAPRTENATQRLPPRV